jgi:hypothetical protein
MVFSKVGPNQSIEWGQIRVSKSSVPALRHVMRNINYCDTCKALRIAKLTRKRPVCPQVSQGCATGHPDKQRQIQNSFGELRVRHPPLMRPTYGSSRFVPHCTDAPRISKSCFCKNE